MSAIKGAKKVGFPVGATAALVVWALSRKPGEMRKLLRKQGFAPEAIVTDKLRCYGACLLGARRFSAA
jgi:hypothetical protein